jgi:hypothetical protein
MNVVNAPNLFVLVGIVVVPAIVLAIIGLVVLARTPAARMTLGGKWPWVLVIVLVAYVGPIVFFAVGRRGATTA